MYSLRELTAFSDLAMSRHALISLECWRRLIVWSFPKKCGWHWSSTTLAGLRAVKAPCLLFNHLRVAGTDYLFFVRGALHSNALADCVMEYFLGDNF